MVSFSFEILDDGNIVAKNHFMERDLQSALSAAVTALAIFTASHPMLADRLTIQLRDSDGELVGEARLPHTHTAKSHWVRASSCRHPETHGPIPDSASRSRCQ